MVAGEHEEQVASIAEVTTAFEALTTASTARLKRYAEIRIRRVGRAACGRSWQDLLHDALEATFSGRRQWKKSAVDLLGHLTGAMRSISSGWAASLDTEMHKEPLFECEFIETTEEGGILNPLQLAASSSPNPESVVIAQDCVSVVRRFFCNDLLVLEIMDGIAADMKGPEIWQALGITEKDYRAAVRRMVRNCPKTSI